jgi:DNA-binding transcriptional regulator YhcF (GntR family)
MSTMFIDNHQSTTFISEDDTTFVSEEKSTFVSEEKSTFVSEEKATGMYVLLNYVHITFAYFC